MKRVLLWLGLIFVFTIYGCHAPYPITEGTKVYAVSDYLHSGILIEREDTNQQFNYSYYSFIDVNYYLDGHHSFDDLYHAIFEESLSAVEVGEMTTTDTIDQVILTLPYAQVPDGWLFHISEENIAQGWESMSSMMFGSKGNYLTNRFYGGMEFKYYETERPWTGVYNCAEFTADMLHFMGVDIHSGWYTYNEELLRLQLNQLTKPVSFVSNSGKN